MAKKEDQGRSLSAATPRTDEARASLKEQAKELGAGPAPEAGKASDSLEAGLRKYPVEGQGE